MSDVQSLGEEADLYLNRLKTARDSRAVLKYELVTLRGELPRTLIFVFEGDDDKIVYFHWVKRIRPELEYEPFPCRGKRRVLQLRDAVFQDKADLAEGVYFFIDRDFDDLQGHAPHQSTFMTDTYSTENYLVTEGVLAEFLKTEYHCHAKPEAREIIIKRFSYLYATFLEVTKDINKRLFFARRLGINTPSVPDKLNAIVTFTLNDVTRHSSDPTEIIVLDREPTQIEVDSLASDFDSLEAASRYRGKFALKFFEKWLGMLADDYASDSPSYFSTIDRTAKVRRSEVSLGSMAAKSHLPGGLQDFILAVVPMA